MTSNFNVPNMDITRQLYCFIKHYSDERGIPPTQREMAEGCYIATGTVLRHLDRLHMWGYIERIPGANRGVRLGRTPPFACDADDT